MDQNFEFPTKLARPDSIGIACSDETTTLTAITAATFRMPYTMRLTEVIATAVTAVTVQDLITDINKTEVGKAEVSILSSKLKIPFSAGANTGLTSVGYAKPVISDALLPEGCQISIVRDQVGTAGAGHKVWLKGFRA